MNERLAWESFVSSSLVVPELGFRLDLSTLPIPGAAEVELSPRLERALRDMAALEAGAIANPDENRRVGHYWLRTPQLAPTPEIREAIETTVRQVKEFGAGVRSGAVRPPKAERFRHLLLVGIGGSALGPQLAVDALGGPDDPLAFHLLDNTDPDGMARVFRAIGDDLSRTLVIVTSKSGGTPETRNGMEETWARLLAAGLDPAPQMVAVTGEGSALDARAGRERWLARFPMWDWVGGRTSITSAVGLLPLSVLGHDVDALLDGARRMDEATRVAPARDNPAARLAAAWHVATRGRGERDMVVLPYRDRLMLLSRYLQQLVMESLGKERDLSGRPVHQGIAVYGNKGSTDQHAYVQQLRDGVPNFFAVFIGAVEDGGESRPLEVEPGRRSGDYLLGFLLGTRRALVERDRLAVTVTIPRVDARSLGALIALFERSVGLYASLVGINAYDQPGVEAGKKAAATNLTLQADLLAAIGEAPDGTLLTAPGWADRAGRPELAVEALFLLEHLAAAGDRGVRREGEAASPLARFGPA